MLCIFIYIFGVSTLTHAIYLKFVMCYLFFTQMNRIIRFDSNFLPSSQRGRLSAVCDEGIVALQ